MFCFNDLESQCNNKPCQGNGYCKSTGDNSFVCICKLGFKGILCATKSKFWYYHNIVISHVLWYISLVGIHILQNTLIVAPPTPIPREKNDTTTVSIYFSNSDCVLKLIFYETVKTRFYTYILRFLPNLWTRCYLKRLHVIWMKIVQLCYQWMETPWTSMESNHFM